MSDKKILVQNEGFLYNENIQEGIRNMSFSTNVLEHYDNVTYNARLYMFPFDVEKNIQELSYGKMLDMGDKANNKIIIAQTGRSAKFSIDSILMQTTFGGMGSFSDVTSYSMKITLKEQRSCMFVNELELVSRLIGFNEYMHRPFWLEIWFSGYDPYSLLPVERIPLSNGDDKLIYRGLMGSVKSELEGNTTTWVLDFYPDQNVFINKNNNILAVSPVIKADEQKTMAEYLKEEAENAKKRYIESFPDKKSQDELTNMFSSSPYLEFRILDDQNKDIGNDIKIDSGYNRDIDKINSSENKNDEKMMLFTDLPQWCLARSISHKNYVARTHLYTKLLGKINNKNIFSQIIIIVITKSPLMTKDVENASGEKKKITSEEVTQLFNASVANGTLCKKYNFGFSGKDTSVLEVMNNYDRLWYMNAIKYNIKKQSEANINLRESDTATQKMNIFDFSSTDINTNDNRQADNLGLLEDIYENVKDTSDGSRLKALNYPELNNDLDSPLLSNTSQSQNKESDAKTIASINSYNKLFHSGQMSTTKFKIIGDPYWITPIAKNSFLGDITSKDGGEFLDSIRSKYPLAEQYRCVFGIKSFIDEDDGSITDYSFEYSLNATGIYKIYKCETELSEGKFIQTLSGTLDFDLIDENAIEESNR